MNWINLISGEMFHKVLHQVSSIFLGEKKKKLLPSYTTETINWNKVNILRRSNFFHVLHVNQVINTVLYYMFMDFFSGRVEGSWYTFSCTTKYSKHVYAALSKDKQLIAFKQLIHLCNKME